MVWVFGIVGFISGFLLGQVFLMKWLKNKSREELLNDRSLKWKYGLFNWGIAILVCLCAIYVHGYFLD